MPVRNFRPTSPGPPRHERLRLLGAHAPQARALAARGPRSTRAAAATSTATSPRGTAAAGTSACYRKIDFRRDKPGIPARVAAIEYDPNRSAQHRAAALRGRREALHHRAGRARGSAIACSRATTPRSAPATRCRSRRSRSARSCTRSSCKPGKGAQLVRAAGMGAQLMAREGRYATLRMPSGEHRRVHVRCMATIGQVGNTDHENQSDRQGRPRALEGQAPERARRRDEPGRSPDGRRRGQVVGRPPSRARRGACRRRATRRATTRAPTSSSSSGEGRGNGAFAQEGSVRRPEPPAQGRHVARGRLEAGDPHLVAPLDDHARLRRAHVPRPQRQAVRARSSSPRTWSATGSASSRPRASSPATRARRR